MKHSTWGAILHMRDAADTLEQDEDKAADDTANHRCRNSRCRGDIVYTILLSAASFACGLVTAQRGPSILELGHIVHSDAQFTAYFFAIGAGGYLIGCLITGVVFGRFQTPMFLFWALLCLCGSTAALPWCPSYGIMAGVYFLSFAAVGCVETGCYVDVSKLWGSQGRRVVELLQLLSVVGAVISPALTQFFLLPPGDDLESDDADENGGKHVAKSTTTQTVLRRNNSKLTVNDLAFSSNVSMQIGEDTELELESWRSNDNLNVAYAITAAVALLVAIPTIVNYRIRTRQRQALINRHSLDAASVQMEFRDSNILVFLFLGAFFYVVSGVEDSFHQFLSSFLVQQEFWSPQLGALLTSWFWCGVLLVRLAAFFIPQSLSPEALLTISCVTLPCALAGVHICVTFALTDGVWACVFFVGMSISLIFPVAFDWVHFNLNQSIGATSNVVMLSSTLVGIINPLLLGTLFQEGSLFGFTYLLLAESGLAILLWLVLRSVARKLHETSTYVFSDSQTLEQKILRHRLCGELDEEDFENRDS